MSWFLGGPRLELDLAVRLDLLKRTSCARKDHVVNLGLFEWMIRFKINTKAGAFSLST